MKKIVLVACILYCKCFGGHKAFATTCPIPEATAPSTCPIPEATAPSTCPMPKATAPISTQQKEEQENVAKESNRLTLTFLLMNMLDKKIFDFICKQLENIHEERLRSLTQDPKLQALFDMLSGLRKASGAIEMCDAIGITTISTDAGPIMPEIHKEINGIDLHHEQYKDSFGNMHGSLVFCKEVFIKIVDLLGQFSFTLHFFVLIPKNNPDMLQYCLISFAQIVKILEIDPMEGNPLEGSREIIPIDTDSMYNFCDFALRMQKSVANFQLQPHEYGIDVPEHGFGMHAHLDCISTLTRMLINLFSVEAAMIDLASKLGHTKQALLENDDIELQGNIKENLEYLKVIFAHFVLERGQLTEKIKDIPDIETDSATKVLDSQSFATFAISLGISIVLELIYMRTNDLSDAERDEAFENIKLYKDQLSESFNVDF